MNDQTKPLINGLTSITPPANAELNQFGLFQDDQWETGLTFTLSNYVAAQRQYINGTSIQDRAKYAWFYLPIGTVVTLMDNVTPISAGKSCFDLANCGRCVDLIGTGTVVAVSLAEANITDCVSAFYWRVVDLDLGAVVLFENANFKGNRSVLFLQDWPETTICPITDWYLEDKVSSVDWTPLSDCQLAALFQNADGSGRAFSNIHGWGDGKTIATLTDVGFNDCMSSFQWSGLAPMKEVIPAFTTTLTQSNFSGDVTSLQSTQSYANYTDVNQSYDVSLSAQNACTLTVQVTSTFMTSVTTTFTESYSAGLPEDNETSTLSIALQFAYTTSQQKTTTVTNTFVLNVTETVTAVPQKVTTTVMTVEISTLQPMPCTVEATRWYNQPVTGATQDPNNNNWWMRKEEVTFMISGGLASNVTITPTLSPLPSLGSSTSGSSSGAPSASLTEA